MKRLLLLLALGCTSPTEAPAPGVEHYTLMSIDNKRLPYPTEHGYYYWGGTIELHDDSTFIDVVTIGTKNRATVVDSVFGRYRVDADSIRMTPDDWKPYAIKRSGSTVTARWDGVFLYRRDR